MTLGQITRDFTVFGTDNLTADDRTCYYGYLGTSSRAKSVVVRITQFTDGSPGSCPMDTRYKAADNFTVSTIVDVTLGFGDGSITHMIICPGNAGGDSTSYASVQPNERGLGANVTNAQDNVKRFFTTEGSSTLFEAVTADGTSDNVTATKTITDTKSTTTTPIFGEEAILITEADRFSSIMDTLIRKDNSYTLTAKDNGTLTKSTNGTCSTSIIAVFVSIVTDRIVLDSDNTSMISIADNGTNIAVYNLTTPGTTARVGVNIITVVITYHFCSAVRGGRILVFADNSTADDAYGTFNSSGIDNRTGWEYSVSGCLFDNATANVHFTMISGRLSGDNRTF